MISVNNVTPYGSVEEWILRSRQERELLKLQREVNELRQLIQPAAVVTVCIEIGAFELMISKFSGVDSHDVYKTYWLPTIIRRNGENTFTNNHCL